MKPKTWIRSIRRPLTVAGGILALGACSSGGSSPVEPLPFEEIEEVTFHESLGVDLEAMQVTDRGVYWMDIELGTGAEAAAGVEARLTYVVYWRNGQLVDSSDLSGPHVFIVDQEESRTMPGFHEGVRGMREGGRRRFVVPPELGSGQRGPTGILIFEVRLLAARSP